MESPAPVIVWFRRDLRLSDNPALACAVKSGRPVIPLFVFEGDAAARPDGAASLWWLDKSLAALASDLEAIGSRLVLRRGPAAIVVQALAQETGAGMVVWNRLYDPGDTDRDTELKADLKADGLVVESCNGSLLVEPWTPKTKDGGAFKVFTPFWRAAQASIDPGAAHPRPKTFSAPETWPDSDQLADWRLHPTKPDWSGGFDLWTPGESGAQAHLKRFLVDALADYPEARDIPSVEGTSRLSPHLHFGEIGPAQVWRALDKAVEAKPALAGPAAKHRAELGWREFCHSLLFMRPDLETANFKPAFDAFPWRDDEAGFEAWTRGMTGYPMVDAGMRELWVTGVMHNRVRMLTASFLIKHLLIDWRRGEQWFWDTLVDADRANNAANWQWVAGSGADASPYFRIFSPMGQGEKFDGDGRYVRRWVPELARLPNALIHAPWTADPAILRAAGVTLGVTYPRPIVDHAMARQRALDALRESRAEP